MLDREEVIEFFDDKQEDISNFVRSIKYGIQNLITWFPIIYQDRDWDQWFIYKTLQFKLKCMIKLQRNYGNALHANDYADQMQLCANLLDRLINDEYLENALKPHEAKWGKSKIIFTPIPDDIEMCKFGGISVEKAVTKKEKELEDKERSALYKHSDSMREQDLDMLFKNMRKHVEGWWD